MASFFWGQNLAKQLIFKALGLWKHSCNWGSSPPPAPEDQFAPIFKAKLWKVKAEGTWGRAPGRGDWDLEKKTKVMKKSLIFWGKTQAFP